MPTQNRKKSALATLALALSFGTAIAPKATAADITFQQAMEALKTGDTARGAALFHQLAEASDAQAMYNLALLYHHGVGVPRNSELSLYWAWRSRLAAEPKAPKLIERLSAGLSKDIQSSLHDRLIMEIQSDAARNAPVSFVKLALVEEGLALKPDLTKIYVWYSLAASMGHPNANYLRDQAFAALSPKDASKAEAQALVAFLDWCNDLGGSAPPSCTVPKDGQKTG